MKNRNLLFLTILFLFTFSACINNESTDPCINDNTEIFSITTYPANYSGGVTAMDAFINSHLVYPSAASRANISGKVFLRLLIEKNGKICDIEVLKGLGFGCDEEAVRVVKLMPNFNPGINNGNFVRSYLNFPISYVLP